MLILIVWFIVCFFVCLIMYFIQDRKRIKRENEIDIRERYRIAQEKRKIQEANSNKSNVNTKQLKNVHKSFGEMTGLEFEHYCAELLKTNGFTDINVTPGSGDQGVDIIAVKDNVKYAIQCKNYSSHLGNTPIQEVYAGKAYYNCHVGVVMTNSTFTPKARELAQATGVLLWDKEYIEAMVGVSFPQNTFYFDEISNIPPNEELMALFSTSNVEYIISDKIQKDVEDVFHKHSDNVQRLAFYINDVITPEFESVGNCISNILSENGNITNNKVYILIYKLKVLSKKVSELQTITEDVCKEGIGIIYALKKYEFHGWNNDSEYINIFKVLSKMNADEMDFLFTLKKLANTTPEHELLQDLITTITSSLGTGTQYMEYLINEFEFYNAENSK